MFRGSAMLRIQVDFNKLTPDGEQVIVAYNREQDKELMLSLKEGMQVLLYEVREYEVEATLVPKTVNGEIWWYGIINWSTIHYLS